MLDYIHVQVKELSGGMKRRLSLAISIIGNPKIIFMDEPTSGMDPIVRKKVWELIREIKKTSTIVLTTHSMEEADILSDRIGIMADGQFLAVDTSLGLKNSFSSGYKINITVSLKYVKEAIDLMSKLLPEATLLSNKAGSLIFTISNTHMRNIVDDSCRKEFLKLVQKTKTLNEWNNSDIKYLSRLIIN